MAKKKKGKIINVTPADDMHRVITVEGASGFCNKPCPTCPWRKDAVGIFPAEAFRISAHTSYDMAMHMFGCHQAGVKGNKICAGFILRGATHNLGFRLAASLGKINPDTVTGGGVELWPNYRMMAVANGVNPNDPVLASCRDDV